MPVIFRKEAAADLQRIVEWYDDVAPEAIGKIVADINRSIHQLTRYPRSGVKAEGRSFRRIVTLKYHFKIVYEIDQDRVIILGIFRFQNREV